MSISCFSDYVFYADTELGQQQLSDFYDKLQKAISDTPKFITVNNGWGCGWLGNVMLTFVPETLRLATNDVSCENKNIRFRGQILYLCYFEDGESAPHIKMQVESAYEPMVEMWDWILKRCGYTDIKYVYTAEEPSDDIFINTDTKHRFFTDTYKIEVYINDNFYCNETQYLETEEEVLDFLNTVIKDLRERYKKHPEEFDLPEGYNTRTLRKQSSVAKALAVIRFNLYSSNGIDAYITYDEYTSG